MFKLWNNLNPDDIYCVMGGTIIMNELKNTVSRTTHNSRTDIDELMFYCFKFNGGKTCIMSWDKTFLVSKVTTGGWGGTRKFHPHGIISIFPPLNQKKQKHSFVSTLFGVIRRCAQTSAPCSIIIYLWCVLLLIVDRKTAHIL